MDLDLAKRMYRPATLHEERIEGRWLIYAPDHPGLPIVVEDWTRRLLARFSRGSSIGRVLRISEDLGPDFETRLAAVDLFCERGLLAAFPVRMPYEPFDGRFPVRSISVWLHLNSDCNLACPYCFVQGKHEAVLDEALEKRVSEAIAHTVRKHSLKGVNLKLAGGEPTLALPVMERVRRRVASGLEGLGARFQTSILSNGTVVTPRLIEFLRQPDTSIGVSLDGFQDSHDLTRTFKGSGRGSWKVIEANIRALQEHGIPVYIMTTTSAATVHTLPDLMEWVFDRGLSTRISIVRNPDCRWSGDQEQLDAYDRYNDLLIEHFDRTLDRLQDKSPGIGFEEFFAICELSFDQPLSSGVACGIGRSHIIINTEGRVVPCPMTVHETGVALEDDLLHAAALAFPYTPDRRKVLSHGEDCTACQWYPVCIGGCPVTNLRTWGWPFARSPFCRFYKHFIPRYITFLGKKLIQRQKLASLHP